MTPVQENFAQGVFSQLWFQFALTTLFAFLTGLEMREYLRKKDHHLSIGSTRTYTLISILGFVLFALEPNGWLFLAGMVLLGVLLGLFYDRKLVEGQPGILQLLMILIVYCYGPVAQHFPLWFLILLFVSLVFVLNARPLTHRILERMDQREMLTLATFLLLSAVILPLLPDQQISPYIPASPLKIWVAVVVISAISYAGYILKRYVFQRRGYLITGVLGGLYSSTATTVALARKCRAQPQSNKTMQAAMIAASGMMYLRLLLLASLLNSAILTSITTPLLLFGLGSLVIAILLVREEAHTSIDATEHPAGNPLELGTAFLFAVLFVVMLVVTRVITQNFGSSGLEALSFGIGFTDIDPFVLSLLKGSYRGIALHQLAGAILIAAGSNDFLKGIYAVALGGWKANRLVLAILFALGGLTIAFGLMLTLGKEIWL